MKHDLFLLEKLLCDRIKISKLPFRVVDVELGRTMQFKGGQIRELETAGRANYLSGLVRVDAGLRELVLVSMACTGHGVDHHFAFYL